MQEPKLEAGLAEVIGGHPTKLQFLLVCIKTKSVAWWVVLRHSTHRFAWAVGMGMELNWQSPVCTWADTGD